MGFIRCDGVYAGGGAARYVCQNEDDGCRTFSNIVTCFSAAYTRACLRAVVDVLSLDDAPCKGGYALMLTIRGRTHVKQVEAEIGTTILDAALKHGVDFGFSCVRGTCARCRCLVTEGNERLGEPTDAELDRLEPDELEQGFRLGCQAVVREHGTITAVNKPYF